MSRNDRFFQTTNAQKEDERKAAKSSNKNGQPIKLPSKVLAIIADPSSNDRVYAAESSGTARRVDLVTGNIDHAYTGPTAPLTCLALSTPTPSSPSTDDPTLYAGSWDRTIWSWSTTTRTRRKTFTNGHRDFVKCLLYVSLPLTTTTLNRPPSHLPLLISGSSDTSIIIWDATSAAKLHVLQGHSMGVLSLALDPASLYPPSPPSPSSNPTTTASPPEPPTPTLFSSSSSPTINQWSLLPTPRNPLTKLLAAPSPDATPLTPHSASIYALTFAPSVPGNEEPDLYTASADRSITCLSRERGWEVDERIEMGTHVRCLAVSSDGSWLAAGGRDEDIRIFDTASGEERGRWAGHFDEVVGVLFTGPAAQGTGVGVGERAVSCSLDGTIRTWALSSLRETAALDGEKEDGEDKAGGGGKGKGREEEGAGGGEGGMGTGVRERDMAGQVYDQGHLFRGGAEDSGDAVGGLSGEEIVLSSEEAAELGALMGEDGGDPFD